MTELSSDMSQFLAFAIDKAEYCVPIMTVREINGWSPATRLPNAPEYMRGVINLRGSIVPIFDLRARFTGELTTEDKTHVVIILAVEARNFGLLVDSVSDILTVGADCIKPAPSESTDAAADFIGGLLMIEERIVALLNVHNLFDLNAVETIQQEVA